VISLLFLAVNVYMAIILVRYFPLALKILESVNFLGSFCV
jgi:hypothetical protein